jgi:putative ABC transport system ATP-binding protein
MILSANAISKNFNRIRQNSNMFTAVSETTISLEPGNFYVVSGHSGSGKSTLLNMLSGLLAPTSGKVLLDDKDIYSLTDDELSKLRNQHMGFLPQGQTAIYSLNVLENVLVPYTLHGSKAKYEKDYESASERALSLLEQTGIAQLADVMPSELSGGEIRRMAIARALIRKPAFIFADEPTGDLDRKNTQIILKLFRQLADQGTSVFLVSHDTEAFDYGDILYEMNNGILMEEITHDR